MNRAPVLLFCLLAVGLVGSLQLGAQTDGKAIFLEKCQGCHSAKSEGITVKKAPTEPMPAAAPSQAVAPAASKAEAAKLLLEARTVAVVGLTGRKMADRLMWNPNGERARQKVEEVITAWGRYNIVARPEDADLVIVVTELQKNVNLIQLANLVAEMKVYRGGQELTPDMPSLWSGDAKEGLKQPSTKVAEKFRDFVKSLPASSPRPPGDGNERRR